MSKFTPGAWEIKESVISACGEGRAKRQMISLSCYEVWQNSRRICTMVNKDNAQVISALPELYEACKEALESKNMQISWSTFKKIQQALVKAEGIGGSRR